MSFPGPDGGMADAGDLKSPARKGVWVRSPLRALPSRSARPVTRLARLPLRAWQAAKQRVKMRWRLVRPSASWQTKGMAHSTKTALIIMPEGVEEVEAITPIDLLRRAGVDVTVASLSPEPRVTGRTNITIATDTSLAAAAPTLHDLVILPGGPGVRHLRASPAVIDVVKRHAAAGKLVAAICAAPTVLKDAGLLERVPHTAHFSVESELPAMRKDEAVVRHGTLITSRGAGTAVPFSLALITALFDEAASRKVAESICYPH